ncbi:MAG: sulfatase [Caldilineaceae bacterium]|nr:sulfatase [Caldilineaceae bacterium]
MARKDRPDIVLLGIDSLRASRMSCYGYGRLTTPRLDRFASQGVLFENTFSPHIPTTSAYAMMLTGMDIFTTQMVAHRAKGPLRSEVKTLAEILRDHGYHTVSVGFSGRPSSRGFDEYLNFPQMGSWSEGRAPKAQRLNQLALPALDRLVAADKPFFLFLRHMDPHSPYLPPQPFERIFYHGNECDPANCSMDPVLAFEPFKHTLIDMLPPGISDRQYVNAQYDGALAYMDAAIQSIFTALEALGVFDETIVAVNGDHGEELDEHGYWYDHHGLYDNNLHVPLVLRYPPRLPSGRRVTGYNQHKDLVPTLLDLAGIDAGIEFDGRSLLPMIEGRVASHESEIYITECAWMRKHGWRTPQWKLIRALEPDFHFEPPVELYNLADDPGEHHNLAAEQPDVVAALTARMDAWISRREAATGLPNPIHHQPGWHDVEGIDYFTSSQQAYDNLRIGRPSREALQRQRAQANATGIHDPDSADRAAPGAVPQAGTTGRLTTERNS